MILFSVKTDLSRFFTFPVDPVLLVHQRAQSASLAVSSIMAIRTTSSLLSLFDDTARRLGLAPLPLIQLLIKRIVDSQRPQPVRILIRLLSSKPTTLLVCLWSRLPFRQSCCISTWDRQLIATCLREPRPTFFRVMVAAIPVSQA